MKNLNYYKQFFNNSTIDIPILHILYTINIPLAFVFIKMKVNPNHLTTMSNISVLASFYFIFFNYHFVYFFLLWMLGLFLDICDGIVARETNQKTSQGSFYDHFTDQIKILLLLLCVGIYYHESTIWILTFLTSTLFLLYSFLKMLIKFRHKIVTNHLGAQEKSISIVKIENKFLLFLKRYAYNNIFLMQGNFIVYLGFVFYNSITIYVLYCLLMIIMFNLLKGIKTMYSINKQLQDHNLAWN